MLQTKTAVFSGRVGKDEYAERMEAADETDGAENVYGAGCTSDMERSMHTGLETANKYQVDHLEARKGHTVFTADVKTAFLNASMKDGDAVYAQELEASVEVMVDTGATEHLCGPSCEAGESTETCAEKGNEHAVETLRASHGGLLLSGPRAETASHFQGRETFNCQRLAPDGQMDWNRQLTRQTDPTTRGWCNAGSHTSRRTVHVASEHASTPQTFRQPWHMVHPRFRLP